MGEEGLQQALVSLRAGNRDQARRLLATLLSENPRDVRAWLAMAMAVEDPRRRRQCYETVLEIDPQNTFAREALGHLHLAQQRAELQKSEALNQAQPLPEFSDSGGLDAGKERPPPPPAEPTGDAPVQAILQALPSDNRRPLLVVGGAAVIVFLCFCCALPGYIAQLGAAGARIEDAPQEQPRRVIPATYTPRPPAGGGVNSGASGLDAGSDSACARAARAYLDRINEPVYDFAELVKLRSVVTTDVELARVVVALDEPFDDFRAVPAPACAETYARRIERGMEQVILTMGDYAIGEIGQSRADAETDAGLRLILNAYEAIVDLSER